MKLTIIPADGAVYVNEVVYDHLQWEGTPSNVHALQWNNNSGWIEFNDGTANEEITALPVWATNAERAWDQANNPPVPPAPTPEQIQAQNKVQAEKLLLDSDWSQLPDVNLANKNDWTAYRTAVRAVAVNPPTTPVSFPPVPTTIWA